MPSAVQKSSGAQKKFSMAWFAIEVAAQYGLLVAAFRFLFPELWAQQFAAGWAGLAFVFVGAHLLMCFFEWGFHRYVLHVLTTRWLIRLTRGHRSHHGLTPIRLQAPVNGSERLVLNRYPIIEEEQYPDSAFPIYATLAFWALFTPLLLGAQRLLPEQPILLGGYTAITWSMCLYELLHAVEHKPFTWWKRATESPRFGFAWRRLYGFHHMHHANVQCNEAISGFFGLPLADWFFGTYHQPRELLLEGNVATARDFAVPRPPRLVAWLDDWARRRESRLSHKD